MEKFENIKNFQKTKTLAQLPSKLTIPDIEITLCKNPSFKDKIKASLFSKTLQKTKKEEVQYGRIVVLGERGVGKSSIVQHFVQNIFFDQYAATTSTSVYDVISVVECKEKTKKNLSLADSLRKVTMLRTKSANLPKEKNDIAGVARTLSFGKTPIAIDEKQEKVKVLKEFHFQLVDTPGDLAISSPLAFRSTISEGNGFLLVCSYDQPNSLAYITNVLKAIKSIRSNKTVPIIIVLNKSDLITDEFEVFGDKVTEMSRDQCLQFSEISTKRKEGFKTLIENITREMNLYKDEEHAQEQIDLEYQYDFY